MIILSFSILWVIKLLEAELKSAFFTKNDLYVKRHAAAKDTDGLYMCSFV